MIGAGSLNQRIKFYKFDTTQSKSKYPTEEQLVILRTCFADVRQVSAREQLKNNLTIQDQLYTVKVRYFKGLSTDCYVYMFESWYQITTMQLNKDKQEIVISCSYDARLNQNKVVVS